MIALRDVRIIGTVYDIGNGSPGGRGGIYDLQGIAPTVLTATGGAIG